MKIVCLAGRPTFSTILVEIEHKHTAVNDFRRRGSRRPRRPAASALCLVVRGGREKQVALASFDKQQEPLCEFFQIQFNSPGLFGSILFIVIALGSVVGAGGGRLCRSRCCCRRRREPLLDPGECFLGQRWVSAQLYWRGEKSDDDDDQNGQIKRLQPLESAIN